MFIIYCSGPGECVVYMTLRGIHLHVHITCMFVDVLKLFCEDQAVRQFSPAEKIKPSDLREDIADEVIEINISTAILF